MFKKALIIVVIIFCLFSCNISSKYFTKNSPSCANYFEIEKDAEVLFIKNKEFKELSSLLKDEYGASTIRLIVYFKSKNKFYCEFYTNRHTVLCLLLDDNKRVVSKEKVEFDF